MGKDSRKHKKKHKKKKSHKSMKERRKKSDSSECSSSEEEWVEKEPIQSKESSKVLRDEWMSIETLYSGKTRKELNEGKTKPEKEKQFNLLDKPGQSTRELNPFWKDGGTGLPPEETKSSRKHSCSSSSNEDTGSSEEEYRNKIYDKTANSPSSSFRKNCEQDNSSLRMSNFERPIESSDFSCSKQLSSYSSGQRKLNFRKPKDEESSYLKREYQTKESKSNKKNWRKPTPDGQRQASPASERVSVDVPRGNPKIPRSASEKEKNTSDFSDGVLTLNQMNELSASILKAELMGNSAKAEELKAKLVLAKLKKEETNSSSEIYDEKGRKIVILTETDSKGFTRPVKNVSTDERHSSKKKRRADTHEGKERVRYFPDDDKYSLSDMFEKEKYSTADDQNATFLKLLKQQKNNDMDDEAACDSARLDNQEREYQQKRDQAIRKNSKREKALDNCRFCINSKNDLNDCIVLLQEKIYLAVPSFQSLTDRHCLIVPQYHVSSATVIEEDVWEEIMDLRRKIVRAFEKEDEDVIFFESAMFIDRHPHMVLHCVPVPREIGDMAPIYFKKALMECESEWSNNKKVVELAGRNVRKAIPKGLPYFAVDFGLQSGYAHVIEDKRLFPHNFAQEIIGGMLDLDHTIWRKTKSDTPENIKKKVKSLKELINN